MAGVIVGFVVALGWCYVALWLGPRIGLVDNPGGTLKVHSRPTPLLGGVGVFAGIHLGMAVAGAADPALIAGTSIVLLLGLADDKLELSPRLRLAAELIAALVLVWLMDDGLRTPAGTLFGVAAVMVAVNAVNLLDGLDALVGSTALMSALGIIWAGVAGWGDWELGAALAGALAGFLVLNRPRARIFLGDNGAYTVGMVLAYGALHTTPSGTGPMLLIAAGLLGMFTADLAVTILRRARNGKALFAGDRSHIYDQLRDRGWPVLRVVLAAAAAQAVVVAAFIGLAQTRPEPVVAIVALVVFVLLALAGAWRAGFLARIN